MTEPHGDELDRSAVHAAYERRLAQLDPLAGVPPLEFAADDQVLLARAGEAFAVGRSRVERHAADSDEALWGARQQIRLLTFVSDDDVEVAWDRLVERWCAALPALAHPGDEDAAAMVTLASRDTTLARSLAYRGFAPLLVAAARRRPARATRRVSSRPDAARPHGGHDVGPPAGTVRPMGADDLDVIADLAADLHGYDARFGMVTPREGSRARIRHGLARHHERSPEWTWVADDDDGRAVGFVQIEPPEHAGWAAPLVTYRPVAYLGYLYVRPRAWGRGFGSALVEVAHAALDEAGVEVTVLHHALPSPVSTPFWARQGYRPVWTTWQRRPAVSG